MVQETEEWRWSSASPSTWTQHEADLDLVLQQQQLLRLQQQHEAGEWDKLDLMMRREQQQPQQEEEEWSALDLVLADMMRRQEGGQLGEQGLIDLYHYVQHHY